MVFIHPEHNDLVLDVPLEADYKLDIISGSA